MKSERSEKPCRPACTIRYTSLLQTPIGQPVEILSPLKDWIIPLFSVVLSIWFAASAKKDTERAQSILDKIDTATKTWQNEIMSAATNLLNSHPQIIYGKIALTQSRALESAIETLKAQLDDRGSLSVSELNEIIKQLGFIGENSRSFVRRVEDDIS